MTTAFVLGGGGALGAVEVGMLAALLERGVRPDLVLGTSVGAINGAFLAQDPGLDVVERLTGLWRSVAANRHEVYGDRPLRSVRRAVATGTHLYSARPLATRLREEIGDVDFADLAVPLQVCAASIERAAEHWFDSGPVVDAVVASAAVPGLLPPASATSTSSTAASSTRCRWRARTSWARPGSSCSRSVVSTGRCSRRGGPGRSPGSPSRSRAGTG